MLPGSKSFTSRGHKSELGVWLDAVQPPIDRADDDARRAIDRVSVAYVETTALGEIRPTIGSDRRPTPELGDQAPNGVAHFVADHVSRKRLHRCDATRARVDTMKPAPLPPSPWQFPAASDADRHGLVGVGADLEPSTLIAAYRHGLFPMPVDAPSASDNVIGWWSPPERGVLDIHRLHVSRSLKRACRRHRVTINRAFTDVIEACADPLRPGAWISPDIITAYRELHRLGWAHSAEAWSDDELVGGVYGVQIGGFFAGESMFHRARDGSKVALVGLVRAMRRCGISLFDVQWQTEHLATLGVGTVTRSDYLAELAVATAADAESLSVLASENSVLDTPE